MLSKCLVPFNFKLYLFLCMYRLWVCASMGQCGGQRPSPSTSMSSKDQAQIVGLMWQMPLLAEPSAHAPCTFFVCSFPTLYFFNEVNVS